eukprot:TRINITY_DN28709_c0_g1_i1.p1 TRINITY_DN28709_c0_g1~~TRINITY_DN28709_c0_g1_i1.p1  ORF type:complete len:711 (+),score=140.46 TRINITY_DN28709_c0_g1_i1:76-2133(+)
MEHPESAVVRSKMLEDIDRLVRQHQRELEKCLESWAFQSDEVPNERTRLAAGVKVSTRSVSPSVEEQAECMLEDIEAGSPTSSQHHEEWKAAKSSVSDFLNGAAENGSRVAPADVGPTPRTSTSAATNKVLAAWADSPPGVPMANAQSGQSNEEQLEAVEVDEPADLPSAVRPDDEDDSVREMLAIAPVAAGHGERTVQRRGSILNAASSVIGRFKSKSDKDDLQRCPNCNNIYAEDAIFCRKCGQQREVPSVQRQKTRKKASNFISKSKQLEAAAAQNFLQKMTSTKQWEVFSIALILSNSFFIGFQTQVNAYRAANETDALAKISTADPPEMFVISVIFNILFTFELAVRWAGDGLIEFWRSDMWWNALDVIVVIMGFVDIVIDSVGVDDSNSTNLSIIRVLRVVRVVRVVRIIRVMKFFRELRMMIASILGCFKSLLWVILVLVIVFYVFGISLTSACNDTFDTLERRLMKEHQEAIKHFGQLDRAMISLYMAVSGGNDWAVYYEAIDPLPWPNKVLFLSFVTFSIFAAFNIVTGVFVETAMQSSQADREVLVMDELQHQREKLDEMEMLFKEMDDDSSGKINYEEFVSKVHDERITAYFATLKLDVGDPRKVFDLLDWDGSGLISFEEFVTGLSRLTGESKSLDTHLLRKDVQEVKMALHRIAETEKLIASRGISQDVEEC